MIPPHRLSEADFTALSTIDGRAAAIRALVAARRSRTLLLIRFIVSAVADGIVHQAYQVLSEVHRIAPDPAVRVLDHPSVGAWATRTARRLMEGQPAPADELARVALSAAVRAGVSASVPIRPREVVHLPSLGRVRLPAHTEITTRRGPAGTDIGPDVRIPADLHRPGPGWKPLRRIEVRSGRHDAVFLLDPWADGELPPDLRVSTEIDFSLWEQRISAGWELLVRNHRAVAEELSAAVTVLTPLEAPPEGISSATVSDAFGCLFLSLPQDARSTAVTLAHELQHTKLIALMDLFPLVDPDPSQTYYAPWRNDPRPLIGLLHGTYAYLGVTAFWRRQRTSELDEADREFADIEFARWRRNALDATGTLLSSGRLTSLGARFVSGMRSVLERWCAEPVPGAALAAAERLSQEHRVRWLAEHRR